jgi:hypothetical protein
MIAAARRRGSIPPEVAAQIVWGAERGALEHRRAEVSALAVREDGSLALSLGGADEISADRVVLATGFDAARPGGAWLSAAIEAMGLPCAGCGHPIVSAALEWRRGLFATGPLAELELGPVARNIAGARRAGERISAAA